MSITPATSSVRVPITPEEHASGPLAEQYARIKSASGLPFVPDMFGMLSSRPDLLEAVVSGYLGVFSEGALDRRTKELIASWTSQVNGCPYCVGTHNYFLQMFGGSSELAAAIQHASSEDDLPVDEPTKALLRLVSTVCRAAYKVSDTLWQQTLDSGWSSEQLFEAVFTTALFNSITRLVDGLGLGQSVAQSRTSRMESNGG